VTGSLAREWSDVMTACELAGGDGAAPHFDAAASVIPPLAAVDAADLVLDKPSGAGDVDVFRGVPPSEATSNPVPLDLERVQPAGFVKVIRTSWAGPGCDAARVAHRGHGRRLDFDLEEARALERRLDGR
jgi:hypothetical protein